MGWLFQRQAEPNNQRQYAGPAPGPALYPVGGTQQGRMAPFAQNNSMGGNANGARNIGGPGTPAEQQMQNVSATPLNEYLAEKYPVQPVSTWQYRHRIAAPLYRDYPRSYNGWTDRAAFLASNAYTTLRGVYAGAASPVQLQLSKGGLIINSYSNEVQNININLAQMYAGASAPVSSSYSGTCS